MRLWLDDWRTTPADYDVTAKTAQEAIAYLETGKVTHVSLDHDLGDPIEVGCGYDVARWIEAGAQAGTLPRLSWQTHTQNPVGAQRMRRALESADHFWTAREAGGASSTW